MRWLLQHGGCRPSPAAMQRGAAAGRADLLELMLRHRSSCTNDFPMGPSAGRAVAAAQRVRGSRGAGTAGAHAVGPNGGGTARGGIAGVGCNAFARTLKQLQTGSRR